MTASHVLAIVPAYNEADSIAATIASLLAQTQPPDRIVVVANNCTDDTADRARAALRDDDLVMEVPDCPGRKAQAMNLGLRRGREARHQFVFTMDADTVLAPDALAALEQSLTADRLAGARCARYWAADGSGLAWRLQRLEYARYDDMRELRDWRVMVASGAAVMYRAEALNDVCRRVRPGGPWDEDSLIEDYALTLDLKTLGWNVRAAEAAHAQTSTPQTFGALWRQRTRWSRGGFEEVRSRGWTHATARDALSYIGFFTFVAVRVLFLVSLGYLIFGGGAWYWSVIGALMVAVVVTERVTSAMPLNRFGAPERLITATLVVEDLYGLLLEVCTLQAIGRSLVTSSVRRW